MTRLDIAALLAIWAGATLVLAEFRWFSDASLAARIGPYLSGGSGRTERRQAVRSWSALRASIGPMAEHIGAMLSRLFGMREELERKLRRIGSTETTVELRTRQTIWSAATALCVAMGGAAVGLPLLAAAAAGVGVALITWLVMEQRVVVRSERWQAAVTAELPLVAEQLGMLLSSGYSLGGAIARLGDRGRGVMGEAFAQVHRRIRHGVGEVEALREFAETAAVPAVDRLVGVLALNRESTDLGPMIAAEAKAARHAVHRDLLAAIERRGQLVWIPVTVATLVPGVIFMAVPFIDAMRQLTGG